MDSHDVARHDKERARDKSFNMDDSFAKLVDRSSQQEQDSVSNSEASA